MLKISKKIILFILLFGVINSYLAFAVQTDLMTIYGYYGDLNLTDIETYIGETRFDFSKLLMEGHYALFVIGDDPETVEKEGPVAGEEFLVKYVGIGEKSFVFQSGVDVEYNLTSSPENVVNETIPPNETVENPPDNETSPPEVTPTTTGGSSSGGGSSGGGSTTGGGPYSTESPVPKYNESPSTENAVSNPVEKNETKKEEILAKDKGVIPPEEKEQKNKIDFSNLFFIGLGIVFVVVFFLMIFFILKMRK